jgi:hypothetical protein
MGYYKWIAQTCNFFLNFFTFEKSRIAAEGHKAYFRARFLFAGAAP